MIYTPCNHNTNIYQKAGAYQTCPLIFGMKASTKFSDGLRLCKEDDVELARDIIELLVKRNHIEWNHTNSI